MNRVGSSLALTLAMLASSVAMAAASTHRSTVSKPGASALDATPGASIATIIIDGVDTAKRPEMSLLFMLGMATAEHLHCCTPEPFIGTERVAMPLNDLTLGSTAGRYAPVFMLAEADTDNASLPSAQGGTFDAANAFLIDGIKADEAYLNIQASRYPGGENRSLLGELPVTEPAAWLMLGAGLAGLGMCARRKYG